MTASNPNLRKDQPYLTTIDIERLTGVSRRSIESYAKEGIVVPRRSSDARNAEMVWTYEQVSLILQVKQLLRSGLTLAQVAQLIQPNSATSIEDAMYEQQVRDNRESRRAVKEVVARRRMLSDTAHLGKIEGPYLRYKPQRWLALIPAPGGALVQPDTRAYIDLIENLSAIVQIVGWSSIARYGCIASLNSNMSLGTSYATIDLASPAMPIVTGQMVIDGGCYHAVDKSVSYPECDGVSCFECARFGREPTKEEVAKWRAAEEADPHLYDCTVMTAGLTEPYACGMWADYTKSAIEKREGCKPGTRFRFGTERMRGLSVRPRLMPHEVRLPYGVTSCMMPAGTYLCLQCGENGFNGSYHQLVGMAMSIRTEELTVQAEVEQYLAGSVPGPWALEDKRNAKKEERGPIIEPFASPRAAGEPDMEGWSRKVTQPEIHSLVLPTLTALAPEDGFCINCESLPFPDRNAPAHYELSLLVRYPGVGKPLS